jgi:hypothetical protein
MQYLYNSTKKHTAAHIWVDGDTACRMLSTGGMRRGAKKLFSDYGTRRICAMCQAVYKRADADPDQVQFLRDTLKYS